MFRFPVAFRPPAFASWASCSRQKDLGFPHGRLTRTHRCWTLAGFPRFTHTRNDRVWVSSLPRGRRCSHGRYLVPSRRPPLLCGQALYPGPASIYPRVWLTRHQRGFSFIHPSGLPLACSPRMEQGPLRLPSELRTPRLLATHVRGRDRHRALTQDSYPASTGPPFYEPTRVE